MKSPTQQKLEGSKEPIHSGSGSTEQRTERTRSSVDLRQAVNAVSDVVQNRPRPIRIFDQIYMKTGDMVLQSEIIANWSDGKRLAFVGDGDAISICVAYLKARGVLSFGPSHVTVFDFDERMVEAVNSFADRERITNLDAQLYNVIDPINSKQVFDCFYTNPPWGASNNGESVNVFIERGMELTGLVGEGVVVIADDDELEWPKNVLAGVQGFAASQGFYVSRMQRQLHEYHLDDAPDLKSCNLFLSALPRNKGKRVLSRTVDPERLKNFYGMSRKMTVRYVRAKRRLEFGVAHDDEYDLEFLEADGD